MGISRRAFRLPVASSGSPMARRDADGPSEGRNDGPLHSQHGLQRRSTPQLGMGAGDPAARDKRLHHAGYRSSKKASVMEAGGGISPTTSSCIRGKPITRMLTAACKRARIRAELTKVCVEDLKHAFGRRLRALGWTFEDRQDLLGHRSADHNALLGCRVVARAGPSSTPSLLANKAAFSSRPPPKLKP